MGRVPRVTQSRERECERDRVEGMEGRRERDRERETQKSTSGSR